MKPTPRPSNLEARIAELEAEVERLRQSGSGPHGRPEQQRRRFAFLAEASGILASSLDYETTLSSVASLAVPYFADWCEVDLLDAEGGMHRLEVTHADPEKQRWGREMIRRYPLNPRSDQGATRVMRTGEPALRTEITEAALRAYARDEKHLNLLRQVGMRSYLAVPLSARGRTLGALSFVMAESGRTYTEDDLPFAIELGRSAGLAVDNARLYTQAQAALVSSEGVMRALEQSNEDLRQFASAASHDLQEPLRTMTSYAKLLDSRYRARLDQDACEFIDFIIAAGHRMNALIQDLLTFSRAVSQPVPPATSVALDAALQGAIDNLQIAIQETAASVTHETLPRANGDLAQLIQVFQNLLINAIKYKRDEPPRVSVSAEASQGKITVSVVDNGVGIEADQLERIFQPFKRAHGREYPGSGLGLAITRRIIERHGGRIWAESQPGSGSTFRFTLPAAR
jgi:signal transduction histidine kinase